MIILKTFVFFLYICSTIGCGVKPKSALNGNSGNQASTPDTHIGSQITVDNSLCILISADEYNCSCISGFAPSENYTGCVDYNECNSSSDVCKWDHSICINTAGSYNCSCENGWMYDDNSCIDIDECKNNTSFLCDWNHSICTNTNGSYNCSCEDGWVLHDNNRCIDQNECESDGSLCYWNNGICINTNGSYNCSCQDGWVLFNSSSCIDIDECNTSSLCNWNYGICINTNGSFNCSCEEGWMLYENNSCIVDGMWGEWSESKCINSCGVDRVKTKERSCNNPLPAYDGRYCMGFIKSVEDCDIAEVCPVDGGWSGWSDWSLCSQPCRGGTISRFHDCSDPRPKYGGHQCDGNNTEFLNCPLRDCQRVAVNLRIHFLDEKYIDSYKQPMALKFKIENAITNIYVKYNKNVSFNIDLHSIEDENLLNIYKVP